MCVCTRAIRWLCEKRFRKRASIPFYLCRRNVAMSQCSLLIVIFEIQITNGPSKWHVVFWCSRCLLNSFPFMALSRAHTHTHQPLPRPSSELSSHSLAIKSILPINISRLLCALCSVHVDLIYSIQYCRRVSFSPCTPCLHTSVPHFEFSFFHSSRCFYSRTWYDELAFWTHFIVSLTFVVRLR